MHGSLFNANVAPASDIDLCVFNAGGTLVGTSGSGTSAEEVNFVNPAAGTYTVVTHGFAVPTGGANYTLCTWALGSTAAGNMAVTAPATATVGGTGTITITFSGVAPSTRYLGSVRLLGVEWHAESTIVRVDTP